MLLFWGSVPPGLLVLLPLPGTVAMLDAEAPEGRAALIFVPVPSRDLRTVGLSPSTTVLLVAATLL